MSLSLTVDKKSKLTENIRVFLRVNRCQIREFVGLLSTLVAACPGVSYGMLYTKILEREKFLALIMNDQDFDQTMILNSSVKDELTWWLTKLPTAFCPIRSFRFVTEIYSDASLLGWGAHCNGQNAQGFWSESEKKLHINHLELIAAFF